MLNTWLLLGLILLTAPLSYTQSDPRQSTPSPSTPPPDSCPNGVCQVAAKQNETCISLEKTNTCKAFKNLFLPVNLRAYFKNRYPKKKPESIPERVEDSEGFDNIYESEPYSYPTRYMNDFMRTRAGCSMPNQLYYKTSFCIDILQFFINESPNKCAKPINPILVCGSTLDKRADSIDKDKSDSNACRLGDEGRAKAEEYARSLRTHPWRSTDPNSSDCISGPVNEKDGNTDLCGFTNEQIACKNNCSTVPSTRCAAFQSQPINTSQPDTDCDENNIDKCSNGLGVGPIILIVGACLVVIGLATLCYTRRRADPKELNKPEPMTLPRVNSSERPSGNPLYNVGGGNSAIPSFPVVPVLPTNTAIQPLQPTCTGVEPTEATVMTIQGQFLGAQEGELNLQSGDIVTVHNRFEDGWALGTRHPATDGRQVITGYFPSACLVDAIVSQQPQRSTSLHRSS